MKWVKRGLWMLLILGLLLASALVAVVVFVDPNDYRDEISRAVEEKTGRPLHIDGDLALSVFPWLGLEVNQVALDNPEGFSDERFASVERLNVKVALMPLFSLQVRVGEVQLIGLRVNLEKRADGATNWDDLAGGAEAAPEQPASDPESAPEPSGASAVADFYVAGLDIRDAGITWRDKTTDTLTRIEHLNLETGTLRLGDPADFKLRFALRNENPKLIAGVDAAGTVHADPAAERYAVSGLTLDLKAGGAPVPGGDQALALTLERAEVELADQRASVDGLHLNGDGVNARVSVRAAGITGEAPEVTGRLDADIVTLRHLLGNLSVAVPVTADPATLGPARLATAFTAGKDRLVLEELEFRFDDSVLNGRASVENVEAPAVRFALALDRIDADRYLPPPAEEAAPDEPPEAKGEPDPAIELPVEMLRELDVEGTFDIGQLRVMNLAMNNIQTGVKAKDGRVDLEPLALDLYEGSFSGQAGLDASGEQPVYTAKAALGDLQFGKLLNDFLKDRGFVEGTAGFEVSLETAGVRVSELKKALDGALSFAIRDGTLQGVNIGEKIREARAKLRREEYTPSGQPRQTDFASLAGEADIDDGVVKLKTVKMASPAMRASTGGSANLVTETLDMTIDAYLVGTSTGQGGKTVKEVDSLHVPLIVKGPFTGPDIKIDWDAVLGAAKKKELEAAKAELEREKAEAKAELERKKAEMAAERKRKEEQARAELERKKAEKEAELQRKRKEAEEAKKKELEDKVKNRLDKLF